MPRPLKTPTNDVARAILACGGHVAVAYHLKKSVATVYTWDTTGRVKDSLDAVRLRELALQNGHDVSYTALAGLTLVDGNGGTPATKKGGRRRVTSRRSIVSSKAGIVSIGARAMTTRRRAEVAA